MPVYPKKGRGRGVWRVVLSLSSRQREWTVRGSHAEAKSFEAKKIQEHEVGLALSQRTGPQFSAFCLNQYAKHAVAHLKPNTWGVRRYHLATLIEHFGELRLTAIRTETVEEYKDARRAAGKKPRTINNELAAFQAVTAYARKLGIPVGAHTVIALPVIGRGRVTCWTSHQVAELFASIENHAPQLLPVVVFLANTGCRKGEAIAAERDWIDLRRRLIRIPVNDYWQPKNNEPREVPVSDALLPWLERALASRRRWLFPSGAGGRFAYWPKLQFDRARKLAGRCADCRARAPKAFTRCAACAPTLKGGPHTLRHTFASHFLEACPDMFLLSQVLGHSETRTTKLYAHLLPSHLERARNVVNLSPATGAASAEARQRWTGS